MQMRAFPPPSGIRRKFFEPPPQGPTSAPSPKADIVAVAAEVGFGPTGDIRKDEAVLSRVAPERDAAAPRHVAPYSAVDLDFVIDSASDLSALACFRIISHCFRA